ncbi:NAD(P)/FAD-dependent oxidoreductase [Actinoplanes sp. NPDC049265]|uniref:NAD(P)/FAD-dependent oxidoreductase n=1 Tax=Actinoplanes sp. NPDC049265 TaxID=3363902 RepID=UPI003710C4FC
MRHRITVLGAGYAGAAAAGHLARHLHPDDVEIVVVNAQPDFVERIRLHQLAAGQRLRRHDLATMFAGTDIRLRVGHVTGLDPGRRVVTVTDGDRTEPIAYDTLLYTLGSTIGDRGVPGVAEHAFHIAGPDGAQRLRDRLDQLDEGRTALVVGGNLTAIEAATEIAEVRPGLRVRLVTTGEPGGWLSPKARRHLARAFERLGITVRDQTAVVRVDQDGAVAADGTHLPADVVVWAAGFAAPPLAARAGLAVGDDGRIIVDPTMRSISHPEVYAAGDSAYAIGVNGRPLPMSCASAGFTRMRATAAILGHLTGHRVARTPLDYFGNCIGLGGRDAIFQPVDRDVRARTWSLRGRPAAHLKGFILKGTAWNMSHPTYGLPVRRRRLTAVVG